MKMKSNVEFHDRWRDYPNRTCLAIHSENGLESTALANFGECSCGECDFCQSVCTPFCECTGCEENRINGFSDDTIRWVAQQPKHIRDNYPCWQQTGILGEGKEELK